MTVPITPIIMAAIEVSSLILTAVDRYNKGELTEAQVLEEMEGVNIRARVARKLWELAAKE